MSRYLTPILTVGLCAIVLFGLAYLNMPIFQHQEPSNKEVSQESKSTTSVSVLKRQPMKVPEKLSNKEISKIQADKTMQLQNKMNVLQSSIASLYQEIENIRGSEIPFEEHENQQLTQIDLDELEEKGRQEESETFLKIENNFALESVDNDWSEATKERIDQALYDESTKGLEIDHVECRSSMCKLEINEMDTKKMEVFRDEFRYKVADIFSSGMIRQDESGKAIIFVAQDDDAFDL